LSKSFQRQAACQPHESAGHRFDLSHQGSCVDGRNTRFGIDVLGPRIPMLDCAQSGGKIEFDFQGACDGTENKGGVLLRHAYVEVKDDDFRLLAGQTWDVISPLNPSMLMYSVGWEAGNIGYRRAQVRAERFLALSDTKLLTLQGSINQNSFPDVITGVTSEPSSWPLFEGRAALTLGDRARPDALPIIFGVSIGFSGKAKGTVVLSAGREVALGVAESLLGERPAGINADVTDAMGEVANMIAGQAKAQLEQFAMSVSLPTVITGKGHCIEFPRNITPISIPFRCDWGSLALEVALVEDGNGQPREPPSLIPAFLLLAT
jgi:CheY-specific phosphatase CheX